MPVDDSWVINLVGADWFHNFLLPSREKVSAKQTDEGFWGKSRCTSRLRGRIGGPPHPAFGKVFSRRGEKGQNLPNYLRAPKLMT